MPPELDSLIERFRGEMESVDELAHVLLKGHLLLDEAITRILEQYVFHREHLQDARLSFQKKALLARSFCLRKNQLGEWDLIAAINGLRNDLSHRLNSPDRERKFAKVKELYFRNAVGFGPIHELKEKSDQEILFRACAHCAGFLARFEKDSKSFRKMVHTMDRSMNPGQPEIEL